MKKKNVTICLSEEAIKKLKQLAEKDKRSMSQMVELLILKTK
jgi:predicted transcriptional regulator